YTGGANWRTISAGYFDVFQIPVLRGRDFTERDTAGAAPVVIINQAMARRFWDKGRDPLQDQIIIGKGVGPEFEEPPRQIIGVVGDVHDGGLNRDPQPVMFVPSAQVKDGITALNAKIRPITWVIRTHMAPQTLSAQIQNELRQGDRKS